MVTREFSPEEEAVFDAIVEQRKERVGCIFKYDAQKAWEFLNETNATVKYGLEWGDSLTIIQKLAEDGILKIDFLDNRNFATGIKEPNPVWMYGTDWAYDAYQLSGHISIEDCFAEHGCMLVINLPFRDIKAINENCRAIYEVRLGLNKKRLRLFIKCSDGKLYFFPPFKSGSLPYDIIQYALANPDKNITREDLKCYGINVNNKSLKSQIFGDNQTVTKTLKQFIELTSDSIKVAQARTITLRELKTLQDGCSA